MFSDEVQAVAHSCSRSNIRLALEELKDACHRRMNPSRDHVFEVVNSVCEFFKGDNSVDFIDSARSKLDPTHCPCCRFVLVDPITLMCGHTVCSRCLTSENGQYACHKCKEIVPGHFVSNSKVNVVINNICQNWWSSQIETAKRRNIALDCYERQSLSSNSNNSDDNLRQLLTKLSFEECNEIEINDGFDPSRAICISKLNCLLGNLLEARKLAHLCVEKFPDWYMGYLRLAEVDELEFDIESALIHFFQAYVISPNNKTMEAIKETIINLLVSHFKFNNKEQLGNKLDSPCESGVSNSKISKKIYNSVLYNSVENRQCTSSKVEEFVNVIDKFLIAGESVHSVEVSQVPRAVDDTKIDSKDFECSLCCRIMWQPVTTPCGHTFCLSCLERSLDHNSFCPLCKQSIDKLLNSEKPVTEFLEVVIQRNFPVCCEERSALFNDEMQCFQKGIEEGSCLPVFVCTVAFPYVPCPLHIFEPRYKFMLRRCEKSSCQKFGMCCSSQNNCSDKYSEYGTVLSMKKVDYLDDGRAIVETVGAKRFKVLAPSLKDGYNVASVSWVEDISPSTEDLEKLQTLHDKLRCEVQSWIQSLDENVKERILQYLGELPIAETDYHELPNGPKWLWWTISVLPINQRIQVSLLGTQSLMKRLLIIRKMLQVIREKPPVPY